VVRRAGRYLVFPRAIAAELLGLHGRRDALAEIWNGVPFFSPLWAAFPRMAFLHHHHELLWPMVLSPGLARVGSLLERRIAPPCYRNTPVVTLSESSRASLVRDLRLPARRVHVVEPGIHPRFSPGGDRSSTPLVVAAGRLMPSKRVDALIHAVAGVRKTGLPARLEVLGDGEAERRFERTLALIDDPEVDATSCGNWSLDSAPRNGWPCGDTSTRRTWWTPTGGPGSWPAPPRARAGA
jgi:glycosyltransferase involved in cell wall biosynthesis